MRSGASAAQAIDVLRSSSDFMNYRQLLIVDVRGQSAIHSGAEALGVWAEAKNENVACGGNLLADAGVPAAMVTAFLASKGLPCVQHCRPEAKRDRFIRLAYRSSTKCPGQ
jgi:uncharacterized Ntn-hydrolase superfamily protein